MPAEWNAPTDDATMRGFSVLNYASKSASRIASNAALDELLPTRW
jgi:hypothetical protein